MKRIIYAALACLTFASCEDFLDKQPIEQIGTDEYFKDEASLEKYTNGFLNSYTPSSGDVTRGDGNCDIIEVKQTSSYLYQPVWNSSLQGGWSNSTWNFVYYINTFLERMHEAQGVSEAAFAHYEGTARFWRAWNYFELVKTFGGVPWYDHVVRSDSEEDLYKPRDSREYVMERVLEDLNYACEHCYTSEAWVDNQKINRYIALAIKSRICLFEGTYRKYHRVDPSTGKAWDPEYNKDNKWLREAADACEELMEAGVYSLVNSPADVATQYRSLFTSPSVLKQEVMWAREYNDEKNVRHDVTWYFTSGSMGQGWSLDADFVYTYLNRDGSRFTDRADYKSTTYAEQFENRDYRLQQTVISPEYRKLVGGTSKLFAPDLSVSYTGYQVIKFNIDDDSYEASGICWNCLPILRYAEVLLNYAEAKAELGEMDAAVWDQTIALLRSRAGVTPVVPDKADPYMEAYFLNTVTDKWILEVRRERGIELCLEMGLRWDDDMRWHMGDLLTSDNNPWTGIWIGNTGYTYDFTGQSTDDNGDPVPDFYIRPGEDTEHSIAISNTGANQTFSLNAAGNIVWEYKRTWGEKKYLRPIPQTAITRNPNLEQNALWK